MRAPLQITRALRHRNYQLFFAGQGISLIGTWLSRFAIGYVTYALTGSELLLGVVAFCSQAPTSIIAPFAGVLVDRWDRHRTIVVTQVFALLQSAGLAAFALTHTLTVWHLMWLGAVQAVINAFDMPARQSFLGQMVTDRADLPNAIALNSSLVNGARLIGPVVATVLVGLVGVGWCFVIDAASYLAVIGSLLAMTVAKRPARVRSGKSVLVEMADGLAYVRGEPLVRAVLILLAATSVLGGSYSAQMPAVADALHGGVHVLGALLGAAGAGALCGALYLASRTSVAGLATVIARCGLGLGAGFIAVEAAPNVYVAMPIYFLVGLSLMMQMAATNTLVQTVVDQDKLGRVMSLYAVCFFGGAPIGALLEGVIANQIGPVHTFAIAGVGCLGCALWFTRALPGLRARAGDRELGLLDAPE